LEYSKDCVPRIDIFYPLHSPQREQVPQDDSFVGRILFVVPYISENLFVHYSGNVAHEYAKGGEYGYPLIQSHVSIPALPEQGTAYCPTEYFCIYPVATTFSIQG